MTDALTRAMPGPIAVTGGIGPTCGAHAAPDEQGHAAHDRPYHRLHGLPRELWLPTLVTAIGTPTHRLVSSQVWLSDLVAGALPSPVDAEGPHDAASADVAAVREQHLSPAADFGDPEAVAPMREAIATLGLPGLCRGVPALAQQVLRTMLWHLDRIADAQPRLSRAEAIDAAARGFHAEWALQASAIEEQLALLRGLGELGSLRWDQLQGLLNAREVHEAQRLSGLLAHLQPLVDLIRALGRARAPGRRTAGPRARTGRRPQRAAHARTRNPPQRRTGRGHRHPRVSPARPHAGQRGGADPSPGAAQALARAFGRGATADVPERGRPDRARARPAGPRTGVSRTGVGAAGARADHRLSGHLGLDAGGARAHRQGHRAGDPAHGSARARGCLLVAFGAQGEMLARPLHDGPDGLRALLDLLAMGFDGGTDVQSPIEYAVARVHEAAWRSADLLIVSDGEFGCVPETLNRLDRAKAELGLRVQGILIGDRETMGLLETCDHIHWQRDWRRFDNSERPAREAVVPVHSSSLTALYFPNALSPRAARPKA